MHSSASSAAPTDVGVVDATDIKPVKVSKGVKRKAESGDADMEKVEVVPAKREARPSRRPHIDFTQLKPRWKGKLSDQMKYCQRIISELTSKKHNVRHSLAIHSCSERL